jgi:hypothetical protein
MQDHVMLNRMKKHRQILEVSSAAISVMYVYRSNSLSIDYVMREHYPS